MNIARLQQAIDRIVPIRARTLGIEFQAAPCDGAYLLLHDSKGERRELKRLHLHRPCAPTQDAVTDTTIEMLSRVHERFGPGKVWTLGNDGASKRIHVLADEGRARTNDDGEIMLRMLYVHEHSTIGPYEEDPESKWPWGEVPRQYVGEDRAAKIERLNEDLAARAAILADMTPEQRRLFEQPQVFVRDATFVDNGFAIDTPAGSMKIKSDPSVPLGTIRVEGTTDGWFSMERKKYEAIAIDHAEMQKALQQAPAFYDMIQRETDRALDKMYADRERLQHLRFQYLGVPLTPAGRINAVHDLARRGEITQEQARQLLEAPEMPDVEPRAPDPLDVEYDGVKLRTLLWDDENRRRETHPNFMRAADRRSSTQRAAVSAHWSAELRARTEAAKERERRRVTVDMELD